MHAITRSSLFWLLLGGLCYYLALPPVNYAPLALAVPICWGICLCKERTGVSPPVKWYWIYCTTFLFWLASVYWVAYPCPPFTVFGLLALSAYLSLYGVLFFVSARVAVHRFHVPLLVAMPLCWIGTEYLRCHVLGGFSFCALEHAFFLYPEWIQITSIGGGMLVGGIIFLGGSLIASGWFQRNTESMLHCFIAAFLVFFFTPLLGYRLLEAEQKYSKKFGESFSNLNIVALQGNRQIYIDSDMETVAENFRQFVRLTYQTVEDRKKNEKPLPDLIVFPETVCYIPAFQFEGTVKPADVGFAEEGGADWERGFRDFAQQIETPVLLGLSTYLFKDNPDKPIRLNSALLVQPDREHSSRLSAAVPLLRYDKMHLVMFGEYIPFTDYLPDNFFLKTLCPEAEHGIKPIAMPIMKVGSAAQRSDRIGQGSEKIVKASINICFESSVAHLIRNQILALRKEGHDPRVLINLSNDGWFRNSHQMEQHLATHVFRAVENRMYYLTASNGGFSAIIDPFGRINEIGERGAAEAVSGTVSVNLNRAHPLTIYQKFGDWYAMPLAVGVLVLSGIGFWERRF